MFRSLWQRFRTLRKDQQYRIVSWHYSAPGKVSALTDDGDTLQFTFDERAILNFRPDGGTAEVEALLPDGTWSTREVSPYAIKTIFRALAANVHQQRLQYPVA